MGQSIDVRVYDTRELIEKLERWGANDIDLLMAILQECGTFLNDRSQYALTSNDYAHEWDPFDVLCELLESAFHKEDVYKAFYECSTFNIMTATEYEVRDIAEQLRIKLKDDD